MTEANNNAGSKICRPCPHEDWDTLPSLELVARNTFMTSSETGQEAEKHITLHTCPELVISTITYLIHKEKNLKTGADVTRVATKYGVYYLSKWRELEVLKAAGDQIYEQGDEKARLKFGRRSFGFELSISKQAYTCYCFRYVAASISNMAAFLGLPGSTVATVALIAAFSMSEEWLPRNKAQEFEKELGRFKAWLVARANLVPGMLVIDRPIQKLLLGGEDHPELYDE